MYLFEKVPCLFQGLFLRHRARSPSGGCCLVCLEALLGPWGFGQLSNLRSWLWGCPLYQHTDKSTWIPETLLTAQRTPMGHLLGSVLLILQLVRMLRASALHTSQPTTWACHVRSTEEETDLGPSQHSSAGAPGLEVSPLSCTLKQSDQYSPEGVLKPVGFCITKTRQALLPGAQRFPELSSGCRRPA